MRTFSQGHVDSRNSRCPGAGEPKLTCAAPVTGVGEPSKACSIRSGGPGISSLPGPFIGPLPLLTRETSTLDHPRRQRRVTTHDSGSEREPPLCMAAGSAGVAAGTVTERSFCVPAGSMPGRRRARGGAPGCGVRSGRYCQRSGSLALTCPDCPVVMVSIQVAVRLSGDTSSTRSGPGRCRPGRGCGWCASCRRCRVSRSPARRVVHRASSWPGTSGRWRAGA